MERLRVGDADCVTVKDEHFSVLRRALNIADDFLDGTVDMSKLAGGGGKGGDLMTRTRDSKFLVKQLNGGDATSLLRDDFLKSYVALVSKVSPFMKTRVRNIPDKKKKKKNKKCRFNG